MLRREDDEYREATIEPYADWSSYHGSDTANRHSPLDHIHRGDVEQLAAQWFFPIQDMRMIEGTLVVIAGVMYVTAPNQVYALAAATGREIWRYSQPRTEGLVGDPAIGLNRGVAVRRDLLFTVTDHAHVIALNRFSGELVWDAEMADYHDHYGAVAAPLVVDDVVIAGISAGDTGLRGFLDAYDASTGERAWRFWTIPAPEEPGSETWGDPDVLRRGCGATWLTGSYDAELDLLYWRTGNPCPDLNGDRRPGDNLYTNSVVALKPKTGKLEWYFQFTPLSLPETPSAREQRPVAGDQRCRHAALRTLGTRCRPTLTTADGCGEITADGRRVAARCQQRGSRRSGGATFVVMVQTAEVRDLDDRAAGRRLYRPRNRRILVQREVRAPLVIVGQVLLEVAAQRPLVPHDDVIEALAPQGANHAFDEWILPRRTRGRPDFVDVHRLRDIV